MRGRGSRSLNLFREKELINTNNNCKFCFNIFISRLLIAHSQPGYLSIPKKKIAIKMRDKVLDSANDSSTLTRYSFVALCMVLINGAFRRLSGIYGRGCSMSDIYGDTRMISSESTGNSDPKTPASDSEQPNTGAIIETSNKDMSDAGQLLLGDFKQWSNFVVERMSEQMELSEQDKESLKKLIALDHPLKSDENGEYDSTVIVKQLILHFIADLRKPEVSSETKTNLLREFFLLNISTGVYDSRARCLFYALGICLDYPANDLLQMEIELSRMIAETADTNASEKSPTNSYNSLHHDKSHAMDYRSGKNKYRKWAAISAAGISGGVLVGLTGGLAAPLILAGLSSVSAGLGIALSVGASASASAIVGSLFGVAGMSLTGLRMKRRVAGVSEFRFIKHPVPDDLDESIQGSSDFSDVASSTSSVEPAGKKSFFGSNFISKAVGTFRNEKSKNPSHLNPASSKAVFNNDDFMNVQTEEEEETNIAPLVTISISGWISDAKDAVDPWKSLSPEEYLGMKSASTDVKDKYSHSNHYTLIYETKELLNLGRAIETIIQSEALGYAAVEVMKRTVLAGLMAAVAWPATLIKAASILDNPWSIALDRSWKAGKLLADILVSHAHGHRPVTLIGSSLGARVILSCLLELEKLSRDSKKNNGELKDNNCPSINSNYAIVQEVYLIGGAIAPSTNDWFRARSMVSGRFVNAYSRSDWVLGFLFRGLGSGFRVAGLMPVGSGETAAGSDADDDYGTMETSQEFIQIKENHESLYSGQFNPFLSQQKLKKLDDSKASYKLSELYIENIDVTDIIQGHTSYCDGDSIRRVLKRCGLNTSGTMKE